MLCGLYKIGGQMIEDEPQRCVEFELPPAGRVGGIDLGVRLGKNRNLLPHGIKIEELRFARIIEVRGVVSNFIDAIDELTFERRAKFEQIFGKVREFRGSVIVRMLDDAFANLEGEIQAGKIEIGTLKLFDDAKRLKIVIEARPVGAHQLVELVFSSVAEGRMPDVMDEGESFGKFRIKAERRGNRARDLRNFQSMRKPIAKMIGITNGENLSLGLKTAEGTRVNDAVTVPRVFAAVGMRWFRIAAAAREFHTHCPRRTFWEWFDERLQRRTWT